jgi:hypothetical protein
MNTEYTKIYSYTYTYKNGKTYTQSKKYIPHKSEKKERKERQPTIKSTIRTDFNEVIKYLNNDDLDILYQFLELIKNKYAEKLNLEKK